MSIRDPGTHWRSAAACQACDPDLFFPVSSSGPSVEQAAEAKQICARCPVRRDCLAFALRTRQTHGVWGGMTEQERHLVSRDGERIDRDAGDRDPDRLRAADRPAPPTSSLDPRPGTRPARPSPRPSSPPCGCCRPASAPPALCDVLGYGAAEAARMLGTGYASVASALKDARVTMTRHSAVGGEPPPPPSARSSTSSPAPTPLPTSTPWWRC